MFALMSLKEEDKKNFKQDMQKAFQNGAEKVFGEVDEQILSEMDIEEALAKKGVAAYQAMFDREMVGGAVVDIDAKTGHNSLEFLYVKEGWQNKGIGFNIWNTLEKLYPDTVVWETVTPYFEKRNLHFYMNVCGFHAVEFYNPSHKDPHTPEDMIGGDYFFRFEKWVKGEDILQ